MGTISILGRFSIHSAIRETFDGFRAALAPGDGRNVFPLSSLSKVFLAADSISQRWKRFFFTDSPSGFPSSGSKRLRLGYAAETYGCRTKSRESLKLPKTAAAQTDQPDIPIGAFMPLARKTHEELPTPEKPFPPAILSSWKGKPSLN